MRKQLVEILKREFHLKTEKAEEIIDRVLLFLKRDRARKGEIVLPLEDLESVMKAIRSYKELLEQHVAAAPEVSSEDIIKVQDMRNWEFKLQEYIFVNK